MEVSIKINAPEKDFYNGATLSLTITDMPINKMECLKTLHNDVKRQYLNTVRMMLNEKTAHKLGQCLNQRTHQDNE